eukprot:229472-Alexandrium_andersonii.AAC.1
MPASITNELAHALSGRPSAMTTPHLEENQQLRTLTSHAESMNHGQPLLAAEHKLPRMRGDVLLTRMPLLCFGEANATGLQPPLSDDA